LRTGLLFSFFLSSFPIFWYKKFGDFFQNHSKICPKNH
jgi:hypothetical protein